MDRLIKENKAICEPSLTCPHDEAHRPVKEGCCRSSRCEAVPKSKKLLKFTLDDGHEGLHLLMVDPHIPAGAKLY